MRQTRPGSDRWKLGFQQAVVDNFTFLASYGLRLIEGNATLVRFQSTFVFLNVYHGRASYEIGVEIGPLNSLQKYSLDYVVYHAGKDAWEREGFGKGTMFQASTYAATQAAVAKVADLVRRYGGEFLSGDAAFFDRLNRADVVASAKFEDDQIIERIRKEAQGAWDSKNHARVVDLLRRIDGHLTEIERKRLLYSEKRS